MGSIPEIKPKASFLSLPPELKTYIYDLAGCVEVYTCRICTYAEQTGINPIPRPLNSNVVDVPGPACLMCNLLLKLGFGINSRPEDNKFIWVNRNSNFALDAQDEAVKAQELHILESGDDSECEQNGAKTVQEDSKAVSDDKPATNNNHQTGDRRVYNLGKLRSYQMDCRMQLRSASWLFGQRSVSSVAQPGIAEASREVRHETLSMFYGATTMVFTLFDIKVDATSIAKWIDTIGKHNAALLRDVRIVYRKKEYGRYITKTLTRKMRELGVKTTSGVVTTYRIGYPFCYCEGCIRRTAGLVPDHRAPKK